MEMLSFLKDWCFGSWDASCRRRLGEAALLEWPILHRSQIGRRTGIGLGLVVALVFGAESRLEAEWFPCGISAPSTPATWTMQEIQQACGWEAQLLSFTSYGWVEANGDSMCINLQEPIITGDTLGLEVVVTSETNTFQEDPGPPAVFGKKWMIRLQKKSEDPGSIKPGEFKITVNGECIEGGSCSRSITILIRDERIPFCVGCTKEENDKLLFGPPSTTFDDGWTRSFNFFDSVEPVPPVTAKSQSPLLGFSAAVEKNLGVSVELSGGMRAFGQVAGGLTIRESLPTKAVYTPACLQFNYFTNNERVLIRDGGNQIRQLKLAQGLMNVVTLSSSKYSVDFYSIGSVGAMSGGLYTFSGSPAQTVTISNPDATGNTSNSVQIVDGVGLTNRYDWLGTGWQLSSAGGTRIVRRCETTNTTAGTRTICTEVFAGDTNTLLSCQMLTLKPIGSRELMTEEVIGQGAEALTNYVSYSTNGFREKVLRADGGWTIFQNDAMGRVTNEFSGFLNQAPTNSVSLTRSWERDYTTNVISGSGDHLDQDTAIPRREIERILGQEVGRRYRVVVSNETREIVCVTPGAAWDNASNMVTITRTMTGPDAFFGWTQSRKHPDGTMEIYQYTTNSTGYLTNTVLSGEPDAAGTNIVRGRKTITVAGPCSERLSKTVIDMESGITVDSEVYSEFDSQFRPKKTTYLDGTISWTDYGCCGPINSTNRDGVVITFEKDALSRTTSTKANGIVMTNLLDSAGRRFAEGRWSSAGVFVQLGSRKFNSRGEVTNETNALSQVTLSGETLSSYQRTATNTFADGSTLTNKYYRDGLLEKVTGTAAHPIRYEYGVESEGGVQRYFEKEIKLTASGSDTSEWSKRYSDLAGRVYKTVRSDGSTLQSFWNVKGQQVKTIDADGVVQLMEYNGEGEVEYTAVDQDRDGVIDFAGLDRIHSSKRTVTTAHGYNVVQTKSYLWATNNSAVSNLVSISEQSTSGLRTWETSFGLTRSSVRTTPINASWTVTTTEPDNTYSITLYSTGRLASVTRYDSNNVQIAKTTYGYDSHGRQHQVTDARNGTTTQTFNSADQVISVTTPAPGNGQAAQTTSTEYDNRGRVFKTTFPDSTIVTNEYFLTGELKKTFGSRTYPVEYTYDSQGRMLTMKTWKDFVGNTGTATNTWKYDGYRGFLTNKVYPDGIGPSYTYTAGGKLKTRKWARGITTTYTTNSLGDIVSVDYSDSTPDVTYTLDRLGRKTTISQGSDTTAFLFTESGLPISEKGTAGTLNGLTITNQYDSLMRRSVVKAMVTSPATTLSSATYGYDPSGRLQGVTNGTFSANYSYLGNSPLVSQILFRENTTTRMTTAKSYDYLNRLLSISSTAGSSVISSHGYLYNDANQRTRVDLVDGSYWIYEYDKLGQVTSGKRYWADGTVVAGQQFDHAFDDIGNRSSTKVGGDSNGLNQRSATYSANNLNQYTSRTVPAQVNVSGIALPASTMTVNSLATSRKGEYYWGEATANNASAADFLSITSLATFGPTNTSTNGYVFVPKTPETFSYDADGNLTNDGRWVYTWDGENRLTQLESQSTAPSASKRKITYTYDYQSRLIARKSYTNNGSYQIKSDTKYLNDGWRCLAEINAANNNVIRGYVWGLDLSGSLEGAGGIGGLLILTDAATSTSHFYAYDGNGNVSAMAKTSDSSKTAHYEYGPFGEVVRASGTIAKSNPMRFSTKCQDEETDLLYYGYRFYNSSTGRWLSRDPIEEEGGLNLYGFTLNDAQNYSDYLGKSASGWSWDDGGDGVLQPSDVDNGGTRVLFWQGSATVEPGSQILPGCAGWAIDTGGLGKLAWHYSGPKVKQHEGVHVTDRTSLWNDYKTHALSFENRCFCKKAQADCLAGAIRGTMSLLYRKRGDLKAAEWDCTDYPQGNALQQKRCRERDALVPVVQSLQSQLTKEIAICLRMP
ncbi:MAG: RHS repeat-associated core domain-containing protein [Verrucomicrobiales bacterium]|nr:RHS repeat-associated core domain-containing protein [Verrucomicrobiales bacterium]